MIKEYLREKINKWYKHTNNDYGITGKFIDCVSSKGDLCIYFEENGVEMMCLIPCYEEYDRERLYWIWQEAEWKKV